MAKSTALCPLGRSAACWSLFALAVTGAWTDASAQVNPRITLSIPERESFSRGEHVELRFRTDVDGYVTIFRIDTDGRIRVLYPREPWADNFVRGERTHAVPDPYGRADGTFTVDDYPGVGYLLGVVSRDPFAYGAYVLNDHWDYRTIATRGRIAGDPYVALAEIVEQMLPPGYTMYGYDIVPYFVERRYDYPRFLCYDCHRYAPYPVWDPYRDWCGTFRIVIYEDARRYPARVYPATDVVVPPMVVVPRFVFRPRSPGEPFITRASGASDGRRGARGATGRDVGGVGSVPVPPRRPEPERGLGGLIRRLFGGDEDAPTRRVAPDSAKTRNLRPTLERRGGEPTTPERRPATRRPESPTPQRRTPAPATRPSTERRPSNASPARRPSTTPTRRPSSGSSSRRPGH